MTSCYHDIREIGRIVPVNMPTPIDKKEVKKKKKSGEGENN